MINYDTVVVACYDSRNTALPKANSWDRSFRALCQALRLRSMSLHANLTYSWLNN